MAKKLVQPKVKNADGTYDELKLCNVKSIKNADGTYDEFYKDENGTLKIGDIIIPQRKLITKLVGAQNNIKLSDYGVKNGDIIEFDYVYSVQGSGQEDDYVHQNTNIFQKIKLNFMQALYGNVIHVPLVYYTYSGYEFTNVTISYNKSSGEIVLNYPTNSNVVILSVYKIVE